MSDKKPGLPTGFSLSVTAEDLGDLPPADLGDFLDEDDSYTPTAPALSNKTIVPSGKIAGRISPTRDRHPPSSDVATVQDEQLEPTTTLRPGPPRPRRRQINTSLELDRMIAELLNVIRQFSLEENPSTSELVHALVAAAHESKGLLELSKVPARGAWGSQSATIFVDSLKSAIQRAIARQQTHTGLTSYIE